TDGILPESALQEVGQTDLLAFLGIPELIHAPVQRPLLHHSKAFTLALFLLLFGGSLFFLHLDLVTLGQPADRLNERKMFLLLQESDRITALPAAEALVDPQLRTHIERRRLFIVERTEAEVSWTLALEVQEFAQHLLDADGILDLLDGMWGDHGDWIKVRYVSDREFTEG